MTSLICRHESCEVENQGQGGPPQVRVQNTKLGISTFWSLDKFQNNMAAMRDLEQVCVCVCLKCIFSFVEDCKWIILIDTFFLLDFKKVLVCKHT